MSNIEVYSDLSAAEALDGRNIDHPKMRWAHEIMVGRKLLRVIPVVHWNYEMDEAGKPTGKPATRLMQGQAVVHRDLVPRFEQIFDDLRACKFPIHKVLPGLDPENRGDDATLMHNNISNAYRPHVLGDPDGDPLKDWHAKMHLFGAALDLNALDSPNISHDYIITPPRAIGRAPLPAAILSTNPRAVQALNAADFEIGAHYRVAGAPDFFADQDPEVPSDLHHGQLREQFIPELELPPELWGPSS